MFNWIPKPSVDDPFKIRRNMTYLMLVYGMAYNAAVLYGFFFAPEHMGGAVAAAYLGVNTAIQAFVMKMYFEAVG